MSTSPALARIIRKRQDAEGRYSKSVAASLNKYGKIVSKSFQEGMVSRANLIAKREERENKQRSLRERFIDATSTVLSKDTLAFLREQSNIAAPTLTSIFAGYESARADRADRYGGLLDKREDALKRIEAADELSFRDASAQRTEQLRQQGNILESGLASQKVLFQSEGQGIKTDADFETLQIKIDADRAEADARRKANIELEAQRDKLASARDAVKNKQAIERLDKQIAANNALADQKQKNAIKLQQQRDDNAIERDKATRVFRKEERIADQTFKKEERVAGQTFRAEESSAERIAREAREEAQRVYDEKQTTTRAASEIEQIKERGAQQRQTLKTTAAPGRSAASGGHTPVFQNWLRSSGTKQSSQTPSGEVEIQGGALTTVVPGEPEQTISTPKVAEEPKTGDVVPLDVQNETPANKPEDVYQADPDNPEFFDNDAPTPISELTTDELTVNLAQRLRERGAGAVDDLGEQPTFEQLASLVNEGEEEDEELLSVLRTIRNNISTEIS